MKASELVSLNHRQCQGFNQAAAPQLYDALEKFKTAILQATIRKHRNRAHPMAAKIARVK